MSNRQIPDSGGGAVDAASGAWAAGVPADELGPIDFIVVEFAPGERRITGDSAAELASLVANGTIRVLDLVILHKAQDGSTEVDEMENLSDLGLPGGFEDTLAKVLAEEDLIHVAAAMEPGSSAAVLVWENAWAAPFAVAVRRTGGQLIASGRIQTHALIASLAMERV